MATRVLIIDDSKLARDHMRELLVADGYEVMDLESPIGATAIIVRENIRAVLLDMHMPVMSGARFATVLRSNSRLDDVRLIFVTGERLENPVAFAEEHGATAVLFKQDITSQLARVLGQSLTAAPVAAVRIALRHGDVITLVTDGLTIGRGLDSRLILHSDGVSSLHATIHITSAGPMITDHDTPNGTWLNERRVVRPRPLAIGDVVRIGQSRLEVVAEPANNDTPTAQHFAVATSHSK